MPKLEVKEHKKLVLKNVLMKEYRNAAFDSIDEGITKFVQKIDLLKAQVFGPLVIHNIGTNIHENGELTVDYDIIVQANDYRQYKNEFSIKECLTCDHCLYLHFEGSPEDIQIAQSKIDLHIYENDLSASGELYTVCIRDDEEYTVMDFFKPVRFS